MYWLVYGQKLTFNLGFNLMMTIVVKIMKIMRIRILIIVMIIKKG